MLSEGAPALAWLRVAAADIRRVGRSSQGVRTMRVDDGGHVAAIAPVIIAMDDD